MALPTISEGDLIGKGTTGMPTNPELSVADLQAKFDELSIDVLVPKFQALVTALENASAGLDLGVTAPTGITASNKVKSVLDAIAVILLALKEKSDGDYDDLVVLFNGITAVSNIVDGLPSTIPTAKAIVDFIQDIGGGDMLRAVYDTNNDGIVDNSEKLGGNLPAYFATKSDLNATDQTLSTVVSDISTWIDISSLIVKNITGLVINYALYNASTKEVKIDMSIDAGTITIANDVDVITIPLAYRPTSEIILKGCGSAKISSNAASADWLNFYQIKISPTGFVRHNYLIPQNMYYYRANFSYIVR